MPELFTMTRTLDEVAKELQSLKERWQVSTGGSESFFEWVRRSPERVETMKRLNHALRSAENICKQLEQVLGPRSEESSDA